MARVQRPGLRALPERIIELLGKMPDRKVAAKAGVHPNTILHERRRRGIPPFRKISPPVEWTEAMIRLLGTATDREVAEELGISHNAVARKRRVLGIPPYTQRRVGVSPLAYPWQPEEIALLGKVSDRALAKQLGLSTATVANKRNRLGIPPWRPRPPEVVWTAEMRRLLGCVSDQEIARRYSISSFSVALERRRLDIPPIMDRRGIEHTPELLELLKLPQSEVRRRTGLNPRTIYELRAKYRIQSVKAVDLRYSPEVVRRMGKEPDYVIAADLGVSDSAVRQKRQRLGIPAYDGHRRHRRNGVLVLGIRRFESPASRRAARIEAMSSSRAREGRR